MTEDAQQTTKPRDPPAWGGVSKVICVLSGIAALLNGIYLMTVQAVGPNSLVETVAHGVGILSISAGLFMVGLSVFISNGVNVLWSVLQNGPKQEAG